jgi:signal transduction histidine kinase
MLQKIRKFLAYIGPYPYNPYLLFLFFFAVQFCRLAILIVEQPRGPERYEAAFLIALISLPPALIFAVVGFVLNKFRPWSRKSLTLYILEVSAAQSFIFIYSPLMTLFVKNRFDYDYHTLLNATPELFLGTLTFALISLALMHRAELEIRNRLEAADQLVVQLKADREELVNLDEAVRGQTSRFLHDRVQSDLMVVGMKLKSIQGSSTSEINEVIDRAIARLEDTRNADLKNLIQVLSPNFEAGGLKGSIKSLVVQYENNMSVLIHTDESSEHLDSLFLLGSYRIIEQGLLNAFVHGPAKNVFVSITTDTSGKTEILISDDGPGTDLEFVDSGVGTAVIDSWVGILNGKKTVDTVPGHGYRLVVNFPA